MATIIRQIAYYGIYFARSESPLGQNVFFCTERYNSTGSNVLSYSFNSIVNAQFNRTLNETQLRTVCFLSELLELRDRRHNISHNLSIGLSNDELNDIITYICTR